MKKTEFSLFICAFFTVVLLSSCKFNLANSKYLDRPNVRRSQDGSAIEIYGPYVSSKCESVTIYRQLAGQKNAPIERVAVLYKAGQEKPEDTAFMYDDKMVKKGSEYHYYVRFTDTTGIKNRTEWSETVSLKDYGASLNPSDLAYTLSNPDNPNKMYKYNSETMTLTLWNSTDSFVAPNNSVITDISQYKPALVFQAGEKIEVFEIDDVTNVVLKSLLPSDFLYTDIKLLGIVGQKLKYNSKKPELLQSITWTNITSVPIVNNAGVVLQTIILAPQIGKDGFDYSTTSDNEN